MSAEGEPVLEEAELSLVMQLKELKNRYRQAYEDFRCTKAEVSYCQNLVNQCRTRLLTGDFQQFSTQHVVVPIVLRHLCFWLEIKKPPPIQTATVVIHDCEYFV